MSEPPPEGIDLSPLHRELDRLKAALCRCNHQGECLACRGFEVLRQQSQMVAAAASQPVLMQVAQEAALKDMLGQLGGLGEKLEGDVRLQELMGQMMERVQEDLGGPDGLREFLERMGLHNVPGFGGGDGPSESPNEQPPPRRAYDDIPPEERGPTT